MRRIICLAALTAACGGPGSGSAPAVAATDVASDIAADTASMDASPPDAEADGASDAPSPDLSEVTDASVADGRLTPPIELPGGLIGDPVEPPAPLPELTAVVDESGDAVGPAAFQGHWTVMWFYPLANTFG